MARTKQGKKPQKKQMCRRRRCASGAVLLALLLLGGGFGYLAGSAHITHLRYADVYMEDLPAAFDGSTLLFVSDINIRNEADSDAGVKLMKKLNNKKNLKTKVDMLKFLEKA